MTVLGRPGPGPVGGVAWNGCLSAMRNNMAATAGRGNGVPRRFGHFFALFRALCHPVDRHVSSDRATIEPLPRPQPDCRRRLPWTKQAVETRTHPTSRPDAAI